MVLSGGKKVNCCRRRPIWMPPPPMLLMGEDLKSVYLPLEAPLARFAREAVAGFEAWSASVSVISNGVDISIRMCCFEKHLFHPSQHTCGLMPNENLTASAPLPTHDVPIPHIDSAV